MLLSHDASHKNDEFLNVVSNSWRAEIGVQVGPLAALQMLMSFLYRRPYSRERAVQRSWSRADVSATNKVHPVFNLTSSNIGFSRLVLENGHYSKARNGQNPDTPEEQAELLKTVLVYRSV